MAVSKVDKAANPFRCGPRIVHRGYRRVLPPLVQSGRGPATDARYGRQLREPRTRTGSRHGARSRHLRSAEAALEALGDRRCAQAVPAGENDYASRAFPRRTILPICPPDMSPLSVVIPPVLMLPARDRAERCRMKLSVARDGRQPSVSCACQKRCGIQPRARGNGDVRRRHTKRPRIFRHANAEGMAALVVDAPGPATTFRTRPSRSSRGRPRSTRSARGRKSTAIASAHSA